MSAADCCRYPLHVHERDDVTGEERMACAACGEWWPLASYDLLCELADAEERAEDEAVHRYEVAS